MNHGYNEHFWLVPKSLLQPSSLYLQKKGGGPGGAIASLFVNQQSCKYTECVTDLDKFNLIILGNGGLVLGSSQILLLPSLPKI